MPGEPRSVAAIRAILPRPSTRAYSARMGDKPKSEFGLPALAAEPASGVGLEQLTAALAGMLSGDDPYASPPAAPAESDSDLVLPRSRDADEACEITPRSILE